MQKIKILMGKLITISAWAVAITTVASTSRYLAYQPELDGKVAEKYLKSK